MNIKTLLLAGAACSVAFSASAADIRPYVGLKVGGAHENAEVKEARDLDGTKIFGSVAGGLAFGLPQGTVRTEIEYTYRDEISGEIATGVKARFQSQSLFLNVYYDLPVNWIVKPYIDGGIGYSRVEGKIDGDKKNKDIFGWNLGLGVAYSFTKNFALDLGYRYVDLGQYKRAGAKADLYNHEFYAGLRYTF